MKKLIKIPSLHESHVTCWLLKDIFWCFKLKIFATLMIFPTAILTLVLLFKKRKETQSNLIMTSWVFMNIFWMLHELYNIAMWPVYICMFVGSIIVTKSFLR